jgi:hypothetical protein
VIRELVALLDLTDQPYRHDTDILGSRSEFLEYGSEHDPERRVRVAMVETDSSYLSVHVSGDLAARGEIAQHLRTLSNIIEKGT